MKVFGQIFDVDGLPMSLANITAVEKIDGKILHDESDLDGNFAIADNSIISSTLFKVSYIGYVSQYLKASQIQGKKIKLLDNVQILENVTITGKKPVKSKKQEINSKKAQFTQHLQNHKFIYAGLGGLAGVLLIFSAFKKLNK